MYDNAHAQDNAWATNQQSDRRRDGRDTEQENSPRKTPSREDATTTARGCAGPSESAREDTDAGRESLSNPNPTGSAVLTDGGVERGDEDQAELNLAWTSDLATVGNNDGETVDVIDDSDGGTEETSIWPEHLDPDDMSGGAVEIIRGAAINRDATVSELGDSLDKPAKAVARVLSLHWPERRWPNGNPYEEADRIRRELLSGSTTLELGDQYDTANQTITEIARGDSKKVVESNNEVPPIRYENTKNSWVRDGDEDGNVDTKVAQIAYNRLFSESEVDTIRQRLLDGDTSTEIGEEYDCSRTLVGEYARGEHPSLDESKIETPPLEYDRSGQGYKIPEGANNTDKGRDEENAADGGDNGTEPTTQASFEASVAHDTKLTPASADTDDRDGHDRPSYVYAIVGVAIGYLLARIRGGRQ